LQTGLLRNPSNKNPISQSDEVEEKKMEDNYVESLLEAPYSKAESVSRKPTATFNCTANHV
jgi:hypothetical protein